jgi:ATP-dependent Lon protease
VVDEVPREVYMAGVRERAARVNRSGILAHVDRRFLLQEVDRLALALAEVEHEANRRVREMVQEELLHRDTLSGQLREARTEADRLKRDNEELLRVRSEWHTKYLMLSQSVAHLVNQRLQAHPSDMEVLMGAMTQHTLEIEQQCTQRIEQSTRAIDEADKQAREAMNSAEKEREIRRRVHERFKRVRREVILASEMIKKQRLELKQEAEFGLAARRFAALAYRALESEDLEDRGQEPMWP